MQSLKIIRVWTIMWVFISLFGFSLSFKGVFYIDTSFCIIFLFNILFESLVMYLAIDSVFVINFRFIKKN